MTLSVVPVAGIPEIRGGDDVAALISERIALQDGDVVVVAQKVVSKAAGLVRDLAAVAVSERAAAIAARLGKDPRFVALVLEESVRVVREERVLITETRQGFVCANAGVDRSNTGRHDAVTLLPLDCDASAASLRRRLHELTNVSVGVVISDTFGRPWRNGICNVALGVAGVAAVVDHRGHSDDDGRALETTVVAVADEIAAAAGLVMGKTERVPAAVVRGLAVGVRGDGHGADLVRPAALDLFR